jgi:hypothetical protein
MERKKIVILGVGKNTDLSVCSKSASIVSQVCYADGSSSKALSSSPELSAK